MYTGFAKLHRKIIDWEWYTDIPVKTLFIHLILRANFEDAKWRGIDIKRGEILTSNESLSKETGLSVQQVRTAIKKLKSTSEITSRATNKNTIITLCNYDIYNPKKEDSNKQPNKQPNKQSTSNQQTNNKQITTDKKNKEELEERKEEDTPLTPQGESASDKRKSATDVFDYWNTKQLPKCKSVTSEMVSSLNGMMKEGYTSDEIKASIDRYNIVVNGSEYYFTHKWRLSEFLKRKNACRQFADVDDVKQYLVSGFKSTTPKSENHVPELNSKEIYGF